MGMVENCLPDIYIISGILVLLIVGIVNLTSESNYFLKVVPFIFAVILFIWYEVRK